MLDSKGTKHEVVQRVHIIVDGCGLDVLGCKVVAWKRNRIGDVVVVGMNCSIVGTVEVNAALGNVVLASEEARGFGSRDLTLVVHY